MGEESRLPGSAGDTPANVAAANKSERQQMLNGAGEHEMPTLQRGGRGSVDNATRSQPPPLRVGRWKASSIPGERFSQLRHHLQDFGQCVWRQNVVIGFVDIVERHSVRETLEDQRERDSSIAKGQFSTQKIRIRNDPPVMLYATGQLNISVPPH